MTTKPITSDGTPISNEMVERVRRRSRARLRRGADHRRRRGRPSMGSAAASVESIRLHTELKRDLLLRAAADHTSVSNIIRAAVRDYLHAS